MIMHFLLHYSMSLFCRRPAVQLESDLNYDLHIERETTAEVSRGEQLAGVQVNQ